MFEKKGALFSVFFGLFLISVSPLWYNQYLTMISGAFFIILGIYFMKKRK